MDAAALYREKLDRLEAVIQGKEPDRVPVTAMMSLFHTHYSGYTATEAIFDPAKNKEAALKVVRDFDFDSLLVLTGLEATFMSLSLLHSAPELVPGARFLEGPYHDILKDVYTKWPGRELADDSHPQFIGKEIMKVEEYGEFSEDPSEFLNRVALPRICGALSEPGSPEAIAALARYGSALATSGAAMGELVSEFAACGIPTFPMAFAYSPLDVIGDFLRNINNVVLDCYRHPDEVKQAAEALVPLLIESAKLTGTIPPEVQQALGTNVVECFFPLHLNEYLNPKLYDEFYWPYLRQVFEAVIEMGQTPYVFFEGRHDAHLKTLLDLPKGKLVGVFDKTDPRKVRDVLGDHVILSSGPPNSLLIGGTPQKVDDFMKNLLDDCKEGGLMIYPGVDGGISGDAKPENVRAVLDAVKKYGTY
ncbi:uroporphyrinogen decarboxylase family protein [Methanogenium organophilum]|uniref:Uroporphyrinogen decarboxylase (URO-D) domain-containing protein n=1 Tax=Methanogenium organophilum TaxID=2199 RepID=A0A9X9S680_METOG|nr:uroporphyrinogen decarboxylase family protein [Methanogenium organophilum]WAI02175.1 hypothetical protein OU421_04700 [Methanogenium organophilum]